jgi:hypothetical protein
MTVLTAALTSRENISIFSACLKKNIFLPPQKNGLVL